MKGLTFEQVMDLVNNTCQAIDIRAIGFDAQTQWQCAVAIARLTRRSVQRVQEDQVALRGRLGNVGSSRAKVLFDTLPVSELDEVIRRAQGGEITVGGLPLTLESRGNSLNAETLKERSNLNLDNADAPYPSYLVELFSEHEPRRLRQGAGVAERDLGISRLDDLQAWLGAGVFGMSVSMLVIVPVYANIEHPIHLVQGRVQAGFRAHRWLFDRCRKVGVLLERWGGPLAERKDLNVEAAEESAGIVGGILSGAFSLDPSKSEQSVQFQFLDPVFGLVCERQSSVMSTLVPDQTPLFSALSQFTGGQNLV